MKEGILRFLKTKPLYILLLPLFFVFHGFTQYFPSIPISDTIILLGQYLIGTIILYFVLLIFLKRIDKAAFFCFLILCVYFFFGAFHDFEKKFFPGLFVTKYSFLLPVVFVFLIYGLIYFKKTKKTFTKVNLYLNFLLFLFLFIEVGTLFNKYLNKKTNQSADFYKIQSCDTCHKPDIYLIIADEYPGIQELQEIFHYDNSQFLNTLVEKGFHIVKNSTSNYNATPFSMASMLNMEYLPTMKSEKMNDEEFNKCVNFINDSKVAKAYKQLGYIIKNFSYFDLDNIPAKAESRFLHNRIKLISGQTFTSRINKDIRFNLITKYKWKPEMKRFANSQLAEIDKLYEGTLDEIDQSEKPRFIYTHLMMPHYPYFFDSAGKLNDVELLMEGQQVRQKEYLGYLKYSNSKLLYLVDQILKNSKTPPIILLMSDHGFREFTDTTPEKYYFMNLNAIYLPDRNYSRFYDGMSNVNQFRILLNKQFGQSFPLLKDSTIFLKE